MPVRSEKAAASSNAKPIPIPTLATPVQNVRSSPSSGRPAVVLEAGAAGMRMGRGLGFGGLVGLRLQDDRHDLKLLDAGQGDAGDQSGQAGRKHDAPEHQPASGQWQGNAAACRVSWAAL